MGWPKSSFGVFYKMLWKNPNELFGQSNTLKTNKLIENEIRFVVTTEAGVCGGRGKWMKVVKRYKLPDIR